MNVPIASEQRALGIEVVGMTKRFGSFTALEDVSLQIHPGSFHALLGENGAGKSTLVKCMIGYYRPDEGAVIVGDREQPIANPRDAQALGIGMVYQHFTLVPNMTVAENLVMSRTRVPMIIDWKAQRRNLQSFMEGMPLRIDLDAPVAGLSAGEKQKAEILKQLYLQQRFLILDEPTSVLTPGEADEVLGLLRAMTIAGQLTVLMITHKFREVMSFADEVSVLRRGRLSGEGKVVELTPADMAEMMIGSRQIPQASGNRVGETGKPRLEVVDLHVENDSGLSAVRGVSLTVRAGEILGIAGVSGNGQRELVEALTGQRAPASGAVSVHGQSYKATRAEMTRHKVFSLPEEPLRNACVAKMSIAENLALRNFDRAPNAAGG